MPADEIAAEPFRLPAGTVTFLLTDVARSTRSWEADPPAMAKAIARHYEIISAVVGRHEGVRPVEQGEGDSIVAAFSRASDAVAAALDAQVALACESWPQGIDLTVRMALHAGEAELRDEGNYFGEAIIRAARLRALASGGQVLASRATCDLAGTRLPPGATWLDLGTHRLKDLGRSEHVFQLCHDDLQRDFAPLSSVDAVANNLPAQITSFIGRQPELAELHVSLDGTRLLTLSGSGGCGKTRLAIHAAADRSDRHPDGVWFVDLAPITDTESVAGAVASVLNLRSDPRHTLSETLCGALEHQTALLVLDNCEHLLIQSAELITQLLGSCPGLHIIATSRQPLNVPGEVTWRVPSLSLPAHNERPPIEALAEFDAIRLFVERARRARPNFRLDEGNAATVTGICGRLDGIALAIELAAARVRGLSVERIARGLDDRFRMLSGGSRVLLPRQQTLLASVDWSHALLDLDNQIVLRRLSVFAGGFTLDAAEAICPDDAVPEHSVLDALSDLVDRSLVLMDDEGEGRYWLLETIREYARARLIESGEEEIVRQHHLEFFRSVVHETEPVLLTSGQASASRRLDADHDNVRAALECASSLDDDTLLEMSVALTPYWMFGGQAVEGVGWLERAVRKAQGEPTVLTARALAALAHINLYAGNFQSALVGADEARTTGLAVGDDLAVGNALCTLGQVLYFFDPVEARATLTESAERHRAAADPWGEAHALLNLSHSWVIYERHADAVAAIEQATPAMEALRHSFHVSYVHLGRGWAAARAGDVAGARELLARARASAEDSGEPVTIVWSAWRQAETELMVGDHHAARDIAITCADDLRRRGVRHSITLLLQLFLARLHLSRGELAAASELFDLSVRENERGGSTSPWSDALQVDVAELHLAEGRVPEGTADADRAFALALELAHPWLEARASYLQATGLRAVGELRLADDKAHRALTLWAQHGCRPDAVDALEQVAGIAAYQDSSAEAVRLFSAAEKIRHDSGWVRWPLRDSVVELDLARARHAQSDEDYSALVLEGKTMSLEEAVAYASRARGSRNRPSTGWTSLTPTELEVAQLVADGFSNPEIAQRLFMARATVKNHLSHIFTKLSIANRSELASEFTRNAARTINATDRG